MARIEDIETLRGLYGQPRERTANKAVNTLDQHARRILSLSPFCLIGSNDGDGNADVTPRGDEPGFVEPLDDRTLIIPDRPGNKRLDTYENIVQNPSVGLIFLVPGIGETLRVIGNAEIRDDDDLLERGAHDGKKPKTVLLIHIQTLFIHCPKAIIRSKLWDDTYKVKREALPTLGQILRDHSGQTTMDETDEALVERLNKSLW